MAINVKMARNPSQLAGILRGADRIALSNGDNLRQLRRASKRRSSTRVERSWTKVGTALWNETKRYPGNR